MLHKMILLYVYICLWVYFNHDLFTSLQVLVATIEVEILAYCFYCISFEAWYTFVA